MAVGPEEGVAAPEKMDEDTVPIGKAKLAAKEPPKDDQLVQLVVMLQSLAS